MINKYPHQYLLSTRIKREKGNARSDISIDWLRIVCIIQIYLVHFFAGHGLRDYMWVFNVAVPTFLMMSAYLYGLRRTDETKMGFAFLKKRYTVIASSLYPFLIAVLLFCVIKNPNMIKTYLVELVGDMVFQNGLVSHLPGCGHLWYMNVLATSYLAMAGSTWWKILSDIFQNPFYISLMIIVTLGIGFFLKGWNIPYILYYLIVFYNAKKIKRYISMPTIIMIIVLFVYYFLSYLNAYGFCHFTNYSSWSLNLVASVVLIMLFQKYKDKFGHNNIMPYIGGLTFEIYLVHHLFAFDYNILSGIAISIGLAIVLHSLSSKLRQQFLK